MKPIDFVMLTLGATAVAVAALEFKGVIELRIDPRVMMLLAIVFWGRVALRLRMHGFRRQREMMLREIPKRPLGITDDRD
jgi:hypothetical protein